MLVALEVPLGIQNQRTERRDITAKVEHDATAIASLAEDASAGIHLRLAVIDIQPGGSDVRKERLKVRGGPFARLWGWSPGL